MIAWWWLILTTALGMMVGFFIAAAFAVGDNADRKSKSTIRPTNDVSKKP